MKFTTSTALVATLATLSSTTSAASCVRQQNGGIFTYIVGADNVPDISGICGGLWDNLKRFPACAASATFCGANGGGNPLQWKFNTGAGCNAGMVGSTWYEATKNRFGSISC